MDTIRLVSISFQSAGKIFDFDARDLELIPGDNVIVETERGRAMGCVITAPRDTPTSDVPPKLKAVMRNANDSDLAMAANNAEREEEALKFCHLRVTERKMEMKLVRAEYLFDGSKIIFYFTADGRVDFRELVRDLAQHFRTRIEMRQIGVRDEAKLVGGLGICGRELCCCSHLRNFAPVSVKMAKAQGLALNPSKISGQCGRLLCCLAYEYETYSDLRKNLPKCGKKIQIKSGQAEVIAIDVLAQKMTVCCHDGERCEIHVDEIERQDSSEPRKPSAAKKRTSDSADKQKKAATQQTTPQQKNERNKNRRPNKRKHNQKPPQSAEAHNEAPKQAETEALNQNNSPKTTQEKEQGQDRPRRRNRRRPRRRQNKPKPPENNT